MVGRGTDIELQGASHHSGLKVLLSYLPEGERDYGQIIGRSGRYGVIGETQMVLNLETLKRDLGINSFNRDFYRNPEEFIKRIQQFSSYTKDLHRLFSITFDNHLIQFKTVYESMLAQDLSLHSIWPPFLASYRKIQEQSELAIKIQLEGKKPDPKKINELLSQHAKEALICWSELIPQNLKDRTPQPPAAVKPPTLLTKWLDALKALPHAPKELVTVRVKMKVKVYDKYDSALAGRMHILKNAGEGGGLRADYLAWKKGEGTLFPNLQSWLAGELSAWNFASQLPILRWFIKPIEEELELEREIPSSYAQLFTKNPDFLMISNYEERTAYDEERGKESGDLAQELTQRFVLEPSLADKSVSQQETSLCGM